MFFLGFLYGLSYDRKVFERFTERKEYKECRDTLNKECFKLYLKQITDQYKIMKNLRSQIAESHAAREELKAKAKEITKALIEEVETIQTELLRGRFGEEREFKLEDCAAVDQELLIRSMFWGKEPILALLLCQLTMIEEVLTQKVFWKPSCKKEFLKVLKREIFLQGLFTRILCEIKIRGEQPVIKELGLEKVRRSIKGSESSKGTG